MSVPVLIGTKCFNSDGIAVLKLIVQQLPLSMELKGLSSVYRIEGSRPTPRHIHDLNRVSSYSGLSVCFRGTTLLSAIEFMDRLILLEESLKNELMRRSASINLLVYGEHALMTPLLTLPHPEFHLSPEQLIPAAEVWPEYIHPVLNVKIQSLVPELVSENKVEFFAQGKTLLDF